MTSPEFWSVIEKSKCGVASADEQAEKLERLLATLSSDEILSFEMMFTGFRYAAYRWDLWGVAYLLCGGCGDDDFDYFRAWLIGRGQNFYEEAMKDPESVASNLTKDDWPEAEFLLYAASKAYEKKTGHELPLPSIQHPQEPVGRKWTEDELPHMFPVAYKKEGICS